MKSALSKERILEAIRRRPFATLAVAAAVGAGVGVVFGSRLVRSLVLSVGVSVVADHLKKHGARLLTDFEGEPTAH